MLAFLSPPVILSVGCCNSFQLFAHQKILRFSHAISLYPFDDSMSRIFLQFLACFSLYLSHLLLLFTRCANSNGFCRCFAFQIGKICCHHDIIRHFQFRKCLPVYSNFYDTYFAVNLQVLLFTETNLGYTRECSLSLQRAAKRHHLIKESLI